MQRGFVDFDCGGKSEGRVYKGGCRAKVGTGFQRDQVHRQLTVYDRKASTDLVMKLAMDVFGLCSGRIFTREQAKVGCRETNANEGRQQAYPWARRLAALYRPSSLGGK